MNNIIAEEKFNKYNHIYFRNTKNYKTSNITVNFKMKFDKKKIAPLNMLCKYLGNCSLKYPTFSSFNKAFDNLYGSNLVINFEYGCGLINLYLGINYVDAKYVKDDTLQEEAIRLLYEIIFHPLITDNHFDGEILSIVRGVCESNADRSNELNMGYVDRKLFRKIARRNSSLNVLNTRKRYHEVTEEELLSVYNEIKSSYYDILVCGNVSKSKTKKLMKKYFNSCNLKKPVFESYYNVPFKEYEPTIIDKDVSQAKVAVAYKLDCLMKDKNYYAAKTARGVLCGSISGKMYHKIREELGLCYSIRATYLARNGLMVFYTAVANENVSAVVKEINNVILDAAEGNITDEQLETAKKNSIHSFSDMLDSKGGILDYYIFLKDAGIEPDFENETKRINEVTKEDVINVFRQYKYMTYVALTKVKDD